MRFLADMGVSLGVVEWLRGRRDDVIHLREQGLQQLPDEAIFADREGTLGSFLKPHLAPDERAVADVEGWILGVE